MPGAINGFSPNSFPTLPKLPSLPGVDGAASTGSQPDFQQALLNSLSSVGEQQLQANAAVESMLVGDDTSQVQAMMSMKKAELAFRTMLQIRNKLISAYNEIKDMRF